MPCANGIWSVGGRNWNEDFEMLADDCNCTGRFGVDAFCLALHGADLHIWSGAWSAQHGNCSTWRGCAYYLFPAEWCNFADYGIFDQPDGAAAGCDLAAGKGAEFEICDSGLGVWVNDVNIIWNEKEAGQWEMRPNALLLCLFGTNCNILLMFTFRFIGKCHFECSIVQQRTQIFLCKVFCVFVSTVFCDF